MEKEYIIFIFLGSIFILASIAFAAPVSPLGPGLPSQMRTICEPDSSSFTINETSSLVDEHQIIVIPSAYIPYYPAR